MIDILDVLLFTGVFFVIIGYGFYSLLKNRHKGSSGSATIILGATDHMLNEDKKRAAQEIVQEQAGEIRHISETDNGDNFKPKSN